MEIGQQVTFMREQWSAGGGFHSIPWPGEVVRLLRGGVRVKFKGRDGETREYNVPASDINAPEG